VILLHANCLLFRLPTGESVPIWPEMISVKPSSETAALIDPEMVQESVAAVFHYFKQELGCPSVSVDEFAAALEKVFRGFGLPGPQSETLDPASAAFETDLRRLAQESGVGSELLFFPRLRAEMQKQLRQVAPVVRFHGLRDCVKQLAGARRWGSRCQNLRDQIVAYLRACVCADSTGTDCTLVVE
jgi:hypothetical protein